MKKRFSQYSEVAQRKRVMVGYQSDKKVESRDGKTIESPLTKVMQEVRMPWFLSKV